MPRVLPIDTMTNQPICKNAGGGGAVGSKIQGMCHVRGRIGKSVQCYRCVIPMGLPHGQDRMIGCNAVGVPCGVSWSVGRYGVNGVTAGVTFNLGGGMIN